MDTVFQWIAEHPGDAAWALFGFLTIAVVIFNRSEPKMRSLVLTTKTKTDDKFLKLFGGFVAFVAIVLAAIRMVVPHAAARARRKSVHYIDNQPNTNQDVEIKAEPTIIVEATDGTDGKKEE